MGVMFRCPLIFAHIVYLFFCCQCAVTTTTVTTLETWTGILLWDFLYGTALLQSWTTSYMKSRPSGSTWRRDRRVETSQRSGCRWATCWMCCSSGSTCWPCWPTPSPWARSGPSGSTPERAEKRFLMLSLFLKAVAVC